MIEKPLNMEVITSRPYENFTKKKATFSPYRNGLASDPNLGLCTYQERQKVPFDYRGFYAVSTDKECDIFRCEENGLLYVPGKNELLFTMNQNRKSGTLSPMPFHSPGMLLMQPEFPAADKAVTRKGRHYGREGIKTLGAVCNPKAGYRALRQL